MIPETDNVSSRLISEDEIKQKLPSIFTDSIVVDQQFNIFTVSQNVLEMLEFTNEQLKDKNINYLSGRHDLTRELKDKLKKGFCEETIISLYNKSNRDVSVSISGFYLGLVSDINGYIILKVNNQGETRVAEELPEQRKVDLDKFIYRAAHDLRGPLATIKGLINLLKMRENNLEVDRMVELLIDHANKMDQRLFQLVYLAEADQETELPTYIVNFKSVELSLRRVVEQNSCAEFLELLFMAPKETINFNEVLLKNLLSNFLLHLVSLPKIEMQSRTFFRIEKSEQELKVTVGAFGFEVNENLRKAMQQSDSIYTDVFNYPQLINFYAAQKIIGQLNARIQVHYISDQSHRIVVTIPLK